MIFCTPALFKCFYLLILMQIYKKKLTKDNVKILIFNFLEKIHPTNY